MLLTRIFTKALFSLLLLILISPLTFADKPDDADALKGIDTGKVVWDVTLSKPGRLLFVMKVIEETYQDLIRQNVTPDMVFAFRGGVLRLLSSQPLELDEDAKVARDELLTLIKNMSKKPGIKMESCSLATRVLGIDNSTIIREVKPVGNTFVSLIGYQQQGYALIPIN